MLRAETTADGPAPAERARTLAYGIAGGVLAMPQVPDTPVPAHATDRGGRPLLLVPIGSPVIAALAADPDDVPATLRISDVAPVAFPDRVRGRAWLHGWLSELPAAERRAAALRLSHLHPRPELLDLGGDGREWTVLALNVAQVEIEDAWGSAVLEPEEYAAAAPDPLVAIEAGVLTHLDSAHRDELAGLLPDSVPSGQVRPLALDRYGMWVRCSPRAPHTPPHTRPHLPPHVPPHVLPSFDVRLAFAEPVSDIHGLRRVYRRLFARAARG